MAPPASYGHYHRPADPPLDSSKFVDDLTRINDDILASASELQDRFRAISEVRCAKDGDDTAVVPNPVKLLARLQALSADIERICQACASIAERREQIGSQAASTALANQIKIRQIMQQIGEVGDQSIDRQCQRIESKLQDHLLRGKTSH